jgi:hypothetical protein
MSILIDVSNKQQIHQIYTASKYTFPFASEWHLHYLMSRRRSCRHRCPKEATSDDRLFLQRLVGPPNSRGIARERGADDEPGLRLPRLQRAVRALRTDDPADHGPAEKPVFGRLLLLPARSGQ